MNNKIIFVSLFSFGIGCVSGYLVSRKQFDDRMEKEINDIKEKLYADKKPVCHPVEIECETDNLEEKNDGIEIVVENCANEYVSMNETEFKEELKKYEEIIDYTKYARKETDVVDDLVEPEFEIITASEHGGRYGYDTMFCLYFKDGVLTDDMEQEIKNVESVVDPSVLENMEEDTLYVRNHRTKVDIEICKDERFYEDLLNSKPPTIQFD